MRVSDRAHYGKRATRLTQEVLAAPSVIVPASIASDPSVISSPVPIVKLLAPVALEIPPVVVAVELRAESVSFIDEVDEASGPEEVPLSAEELVAEGVAMGRDPAEAEVSDEDELSAEESEASVEVEFLL